MFHGTLGLKHHVLARIFGMATRQREVTIYDGRRRLGRIVIAQDGAAKAFGRAGEKIGDFADLNAAVAAVNDQPQSAEAA
jgi:hypothetical protein